MKRHDWFEDAVVEMYPNDVCSCGHHLMRHIEPGPFDVLPCSDCQCERYDGPMTPGPL
jgi:hypothetical protein